ncbi:MAG: hypothetical protein A2900_05520 [Candidatus Chisholmbacteria bacterium RIFCSPLOWO2_01_FULL_50_28]|uniref:Type 4 fimbrial biogenesis protein PilX N-terminal domain-containing protein n=1 Tax=Candidatus Chisholmbacteria bacterium RIFCSPHIGHO2_01_FULL_52_32 TaxID=1797591 RepID=A0A1G1VS33_9BACT|nr:MAG: hypothetical protein A2786_01225 [Candidatus Chisholmbacteria bacterium RIFCSPHIGHO2_01_FULL_52_32]OGY20503.1 MAG: hypothetical protein A2900_05520 [Candidatus Chisholmbacteria bacterium RIFCSPLOWO2_01_FULL_50_28]
MKLHSSKLYALRSTLYAQNGSILISLLITAAIFSIVIYSLLAVIATQFDFTFRQVAGDQAYHIAEAGINYYRWHLFQAPTDFSDGTGGPGPYEHEYRDPQGAPIGNFSLEITPPGEGSTIVTIKSTGRTLRYPTIQRSITVRLGQTSYASFAFLSNASLWLGSGMTVNGRAHTNTGIRQDGVNTSLITSAQETYVCGKETGCSPPEDKPGVWGTGVDQSLWKFPVTLIDFNAISYDFGKLKSEAQANGVYYGPSGYYGYNLIFKDNGTVDIYQVISAKREHGWAVNDGCANRRQTIQNQTLLATYSLSDAPVIFLEDFTWISGTVNGRTTVVAAKFPIQTAKTDVWITDNLKYLAKDGNHALGLIANNDIYFVRDVPDDFEVDAALLAQQGAVIRHGYLSYCGDHPSAVRNSLSIYGSLISYEKSYWNFGTEPISGFRTRTITFDPNIAINPPPYYPSFGTYDLISWTEL